METRSRPVPVTVLGGADAAGLAAAIAHEDDCVVAAGWNGPGSIVVAADTAHRAPDCPCCAMRLDLIEGLLRAVRCANPPSHVLVAAEPDDDLATIVYTVLSDADLARHVQLDGVVVALDSVAGATRLVAGHPLGAPDELEELAMADVVVLARSDRLTDDGLDRLRSGLRTINAVGDVVTHGPDNAGQRRVLRDRLLDVGAWSGAPRFEGTWRTGHPSLNATDDHAVQTLVLQACEPLDADAVDEWFDALIASHATRLLRLHGVLSVDDEPNRTCCVGVRSFAISWTEPLQPDLVGLRDSHVVIVGRGLDVETLSREFAATRAR